MIPTFKTPDMLLRIFLILHLLHQIRCPRPLPPKYQCPSQTSNFHPCTCHNDSDEGIDLRCENVNVAMVSVGTSERLSSNKPSSHRKLSLRQSARVYIQRNTRKTFDFEEQQHFSNFKRCLLRLVGEFTELGSQHESSYSTGVSQYLQKSPAFDHKVYVHKEPVDKDFQCVLQPAEDSRQVHGEKFKVSQEINELHSGAFVELANITELDLSYNNLSKIPEECFVTSDMTKLVLNYNQFEDASNIPIQNLSSIKILQINHNPLTKLPKHSFTSKKMYELHTLDLSQNKIKEIASGVLENFGVIRFINISHNSIEKITGGTFRKISTVLEVDVSHNEVQRITSSSFTGLNSIRTLRLNDNKIPRIFELPVALNELHLQNNLLDDIKPGTFPSMNSLIRLYVDNNNLTRLEKGAFKNLLTLQVLSLNNNGIEEVPVLALEHLSSLRYLHLSNNGLTTLRRKAFGKLPVVFELHLDHNNLNYVAVGAFEGLLQVLKINMSYNSIDYLAPEVFRGRVALTNIDISHNKIVHLENRTHGLFENLQSLKTLNVLELGTQYLGSNSAEFA
ncbi:Leucine-rich repeat-containing protein 15 [Nymphon striatum]|nr:Leucine-rich repeat-containing protein 15 [Nymphon striatum]